MGRMRDYGKNLLATKCPGAAIAMLKQFLCGFKTSALRKHLQLQLHLLSLNSPIPMEQQLPC